ncbi:transcriptional regulator [Mycolicibacterium arabiense]|uniref:Transcriptional regulator n=2 Tax=Mycobacteriaceae TaxID=1762 RepID=A0A7I7S2S6_9MYCO|nr:GAF and ANTAR domain-containing protein [Mycolicibacterium arabiense]MCV7376990.1 GAF and ANTAR domain-containing protein [Mycolicibacterium arabiense]BBY50740.1 transcriptional regulator [Mycolicibacterium arabiense]
MTAGPTPADELAAVFAHLSGILLTEATVKSALETLTSLTANTIGNSIGAGISLLSADGKRTSSAATDPLVERLDDLQYDLDQGPCLSSWRELAAFRSDGREDEGRWPAWVPRARELGMRSFLSAPLIHADKAYGAMKVYSTQLDAFDEQDEDLLRRFGEQAAIFVGNVQTVEAATRVSDSLKETLRIRDVVATARGIVMARRQVSSEDALRELMADSHRTRRSLRDVAESVVDSVTDE